MRDRGKEASEATEVIYHTSLHDHAQCHVVLPFKQPTLFSYFAKETTGKGRIEAITVT